MLELEIVEVLEDVTVVVFEVVDVDELLAVEVVTEEDDVQVPNNKTAFELVHERHSLFFIFYKYIIILYITICRNSGTCST